MSKRPVRRRLIPRYVSTHTSQPIPVTQYVLNHCNNLGTYVAVFMFARLMALLCARNFLSAAELRYVVEGEWLHTEWADWTPDQEIEEGKELPIIKER